MALNSSGVGTYDVSLPKRAADDADGTTSLEELIAAAHSSCYAMALSNEVATAGGTLLTQRAGRRGARRRPGGRLQADRDHVTVSGDVEGLDADGFRAAAEAAKVGCPVSKALAAVDITLDVES